MHHLFLVLAVLLISRLASGRSSSDAPPRIGFADTLLFNDSLRYTAFGYDGPAPLFVQAWFPVTEQPAALPLTFKQLRSPSLDPALTK